MTWHGIYVVEWLVTPDDDDLPERSGKVRVTALSMTDAANQASERVGWDLKGETITLRARRATARGQLPPLPSPRDA